MLKQYHELRIKQRLRGSGETAKRILSQFTVEPTTKERTIHVHSPLLDSNHTDTSRYTSHPILDAPSRIDSFHILPNETTITPQKRTVNDTASHTSKRHRSNASLSYSGVSHELDEFMDSAVPARQQDIPAATVSIQGYAISSSQVGLVTPDRDHLQHDVPPSPGEESSMVSFRTSSSRGSIEGAAEPGRLDTRVDHVEQETLHGNREHDALQMEKPHREAVPVENSQGDQVAIEPLEKEDPIHDQAANDELMDELVPTDGEAHAPETGVQHSDHLEQESEETEKEANAEAEIKTKAEAEIKTKAETEKETDINTSEITKGIDSVHIETSDEKDNPMMPEKAMMDMEIDDDYGYEEDIEQPVQEETVEDKDSDGFKYTEEELLTKVVGLETVKRTAYSKRFARLAKMHTDTMKRVCTDEMRQIKNSTHDVLGRSVIDDFHGRMMETLEERTEDFEDYIEYSDTLRRYFLDAQKLEKRQFMLTTELLTVDRRIEKLKKEIAAVKEEVAVVEAIDDYLGSVKQLIHPSH